MRTTSILAFLLCAAAAACADDPAYMDPAQNLEVGADPTMMGVPATGSMTLPIRLPNQHDMDLAAALQAQYPNIMIPYVRVGDFAMDVEWTIKNLSNTDGVAFVDLNGANELFAYVPGNFANPLDDEAPPPPALAGHVPTHVPANGTVSGVFREDQLREASVDLDMITRAGISPFKATLEPGDADQPSFQPVQLIDPTMPDLGYMNVGDPIPQAAYAQMIRVDLVFTADQHMVLEYSVRVRDYRGLLHPMLLQAPAGELQVFSPADYVPAVPPA
jgi:hypothetical protein